MLASEILLLVGVGMTFGGKLLSIAGKMGVEHVRDESRRIVASKTQPQYKRLVINNHLDHIERDYAALKVVHGQTVILNAKCLARITLLESVLKEHDVAIPLQPEASS